ncbi:MAG: hypothetical protein ACI9HX_000964, partial [Pseudoalteromonas tetraodonis]
AAFIDLLWVATISIVIDNANNLDHGLVAIVIYCKQS